MRIHEIDLTEQGFECSKTQFPDLTAAMVEGIISEFAAHGFSVTSEAVWHNFFAWCNDLKSGYRDTDNGYFLFSPCGCNPLSFHAEELNGKPYQNTYEC